MVVVAESIMLDPAHCKYYSRSAKTTPLTISKPSLTGRYLPRFDKNKDIIDWSNV